MKAVVLFFLLLPFLCFAQENRTNTANGKPSTTACPTFKNKGKTKAEYFQYLRTARSPKQVPTAPTNVSAKVQQSVVQQKTKTPDPVKPVTEKKTAQSQISSTSLVKAAKPETPLVSTTASTNPVKPENAVLAAPAPVNTEGTRVTEPETVRKPETPDKLEDAKTKLKRKFIFSTRKTTKVRKHSNTKCPSF